MWRKGTTGSDNQRWPALSCMCISRTTGRPRPLKSQGCASGARYRSRPGARPVGDKRPYIAVRHSPAMGSKQRAADKGTERARSVAVDLGGELRRAREQHGLSQAVVGRAVRLSASQVSRIERARSKHLSIHHIARLLAVVGLDLSARAYPAGPPIRDAVHLALLNRLRDRVGPAAAWRFEVPVGRVGDPRAWDAVLAVGAARVAVEAETRPRDLQALQRRVALKLRDDPGISGVVLLLANTRHNRNLMRESGDALRVDFPLPCEAVLRPLAEGRD